MFSKGSFGYHSRKTINARTLSLSKSLVPYRVPKKSNTRLKNLYDVWEQQDNSIIIIIKWVTHKKCPPTKNIDSKVYLENIGLIGQVRIRSKYFCRGKDVFIRIKGKQPLRPSHIQIRSAHAVVEEPCRGQLCHILFKYRGDKDHFFVLW